MKPYLIILFAFLSSGVFGQNPQYTVSIRHFDISKGLSNNDVFAVHKDQRGLIWLGTRNGLNRFDGRFFKQYHNLEANSIHQIEEDEEGYLWLINGYEINTNRVKSIFFINIFSGEIIQPAERFTTTPFNWESVVLVKKREDGTFFLGLNDGKIYTFHPRKGFQLLKQHPTTPNLINFDFHKNGRFWIYLADENRKNIRWTYVEETAASIREYTFPKGGKWRQLGKDKTDRIWYLERHVSEESEIHIFSPNGTIESFPIHQFSPHLPFSTYLIWQDWAKFLPSQNTVLTNYFGELKLYDKFTKELIYDFTQHNALTKQLWRQPYFESDELFWLPTSNGVFLVSCQKNPFQQLLFNKEFAPSCRGIWKENDSTVIVNTYKGTFLINPQKPAFHEKISLSESVQIPVLRSQTGDYWFGNQNLTQWNKETKKEAVYALNIPPTLGGLRSLVELKDGKIGFCGGRIMGYFDPKTKEIVWEKSSVDASKNRFFGQFHDYFMNHYTLYGFQKDNDGNLWLNTTRGLFSFNFENGLKEQFSKEQKGKNYLPATVFRHFYQDKDGIFWLATGDGGLIRWDKKNNNYQQFTTETGLTSNAFYALFGDDFGNIWLSSDNGITQFNRTTHESIAYLPQDGTTSHEYNRGSYCQGQDGTIYFGSIDGVTAFHPKDFINRIGQKPNVKLIITDIEQYDSRLGKLINRTANFLEDSTIVLKPKDQFLRFSFLLDDYFNQEQIKYAFRIKGYEKDWNEGRNNEIRIGRLPYGKYILQVKGRLSNGQFSQQELQIPIIVLRPFYLKWWFILLIISSLVYSIFLIFKWRTAQVYKRKQELEQLVNERTELISLQNQKLKKDKTIIEEQAAKLKDLDSLKTRFFTNISHELRTPLSLIFGSVESVLRKNELTNRDFSLLMKAQQNSRSLLRLIREILDISKLESGKLALEEQPILLYQELRKIFASFESQALHKDIELQFFYAIKTPLTLLYDKKKLESIVQNLLSNALKFTNRSGKVTLKVTEQPNTISITVSDTGRGILAKDLPYVFDRFYQGKKTENLAPQEGGTGIGLAICKEYVKLMNGSIWVESPNKISQIGSVFYVELPKKEIAGVPLKVEKTQKTVSISTKKAIATSKDTILIVEDNAQMMDYLTAVLQENYEILTAENGQEGLRILERNLDAKRIVPDLILSDIMMPVMDGFQFLEILKKETKWKNIPVLMLTAKGNETDKLKALRIGVDDYLVKPFSEVELKVRLKNLITNHKNKIAYAQMLSNDEKQILQKINHDKKAFKKEIKWLANLEKITIQHLPNFNLSVETLAQEMNMGRTSFFTKVKKQTGLTPKLYLQEVRLLQARKKLENGEATSVKSVAYAVGIKDVKYFSQLFKKRFGRLPSSYLN